MKKKRIERPRLKRPENAATVLQQVLGGHDLQTRLQRYKAWQIWEQVVGQQIATHARPYRMRDGTLEVRVDHPVWMQQLRLMAPQILQRLNKALGDELISEIFWRRGKPEAMPRRQRGIDRPLQLSPLTEQEKASIEQELTNLPDPEVKQALASLWGKQKRLDKTRR